MSPEAQALVGDADVFPGAEMGEVIHNEAAVLPDDDKIAELTRLAQGKHAAKEDDGEKGGDPEVNLTVTTDEAVAKVLAEAGGTDEAPAAEAGGAGKKGGGTHDVDESEATGEFAADRLRSFIERIERLDEEKQALMADIREIFAEAKGNGFDVKVIRSILRLRKLETSDREEQDALLDLYRSTLGV